MIRQLRSGMTWESWRGTCRAMTSWHVQHEQGPIRLSANYFPSPNLIQYLQRLLLLSAQCHQSFHGDIFPEQSTSDLIAGH